MKALLPVLLLVLCSTSGSTQTTCSTALPISLGINTIGVITGDAPQNLCVGNVMASAGAWYVFTATVDTSIHISTHVDGYPDVDTRMHIYSGDCAALICHASDDDSGPGLTSQTSFPVLAGASYTIVFDSYWSASGFAVELVEVGIPAPPASQVTFSPGQTPSIGYIMGAVDMNDDGLDDLVAPGGASFNVAYQLPAGGYEVTNFPTGQVANQASWSFAVGDWDSNGHRDLLYGGGNGASFLKADATGGTYSQVFFPQYIFCQRTNFVDINNDGHLDAFSCHDVAPNVAFMNNGSGDLEFVQGGFGFSCGNYGSIWTDMNNDGAMDLFVAKCGCDPADLLMLNDGNGVMTNMAPSQGLADGHQSWSSAWGDFDNDGDMDVLIGASSSGYHKLMSNNGDGTFQNVTVGSGMDQFTGQSIEWTAHDLNNDGWLDIIGGWSIHYNLGNMTFASVPSATTNGPVGDLNNDGFLDIVSWNGVSLNNGNENNWIKIIPQGVVSNRDAIGARVTITSALGLQIRDVKSGDGFEFMSYIGADFGIGEDDAVTEVRVNWPSGRVDILENPEINTTHRIIETLSTALGDQEAITPGLFPNPATDHVTLTGIRPGSRIEVIDASGKTVKRELVSNGQLSVADLAPGTYQVRSIDTKKILDLRFTKQ